MPQRRIFQSRGATISREKSIQLHRRANDIVCTMSSTPGKAEEQLADLELLLASLPPPLRDGERSKQALTLASAFPASADERGYVWRIVVQRLQEEADAGPYEQPGGLHIARRAEDDGG